jgi:hypothetical protein
MIWHWLRKFQQEFVHVLQYSLSRIMAAVFLKLQSMKHVKNVIIKIILITTYFNAVF